MAVVVFGSVRSSPGTTTTALAVGAALRSATVVDADPDGGCVGVRFGLELEPNLASFAAATRAASSASSVDEHAQPLPGGLPAIVGLPSPDRSAGLWRSAGASIAGALAAVSDRYIIADIGRITPTTPTQPVIEAADLRVVVARPWAEDLYPLAQRIPVLSQLGPVCVALVGDQPYGPGDVAAQLGVPVFGIAVDRRAADALAGRASARRWSMRTPLARSAVELAKAISEMVPCDAATAGAGGLR